MRILIVEDVSAVGRATARLLRRHGYAVANVASCLEGSAMRGHFVCGIFDIDLPDGNGIELATRMLADQRVDTVVFFSACSEAATRRRAERVGRFVHKGDGVAELVRTVAQLMTDGTVVGPVVPTRRRERQRSGVRSRDGFSRPRASGGDE